MTRSRVLADLAETIAGLRLSHPARIAVDGRTASGKTTLADELAGILAGTGRQMIRTSIDGFHRPKSERYARGRSSPEGYYYDARDLDAVVTLLLAPLGPGGDRRYRTASFDLDNDRPLQQEPRLADADAILVVDGTFLQRPELRGHWDAVIFVEVAQDIAARRGIARDGEMLGGRDDARRLYAERYSPAFALYQRLCPPQSIADAVLNNDDPADPRLNLRLGGRLVAKTVT